MKDGHKVIIPQCLKDATEEYINENSLKPTVLEFLDDLEEKLLADVSDLSLRISSEELYALYREWSRDNKRENLTIHKFIGKLKKEGFKKERLMHQGKQMMCILGIGLLDANLDKVIETLSGSGRFSTFS